MRTIQLYLAQRDAELKPDWMLKVGDFKKPLSLYTSKGKATCLWLTYLAHGLLWMTAGDGWVRAKGNGRKRPVGSGEEGISDFV